MGSSRVKLKNHILSAWKPGQKRRKSPFHMQGKFITFEGSEGCGKSTQIEILADWLKQHDIPAIILREPGGTKLGEAIRHLLKHDPAGFGMTSEAELLLFAASRAELVRKIILPALSQGQWVICDRFLDSTLVYQGLARGLPLDILQTINHFASDGYLPDLTLLLDLELEEARNRIMRRVRPVGETDRIESLPEEFFQKVREGYLALAKEQPQRVKLIHAGGTKIEIAKKILKEIQHAFHLRLD